MLPNVLPNRTVISCEQVINCVLMFGSKVTIIDADARLQGERPLNCVLIDRDNVPNDNERERMQHNVSLSFQPNADRRNVPIKMRTRFPTLGTGKFEARIEFYARARSNTSCTWHVVFSACHFCTLPRRTSANTHSRYGSGRSCLRATATLASTGFLCACVIAYKLFPDKCGLFLTTTKPTRKKHECEHITRFAPMLSQPQPQPPHRRK